MYQEIDMFWYFPPGPIPEQSKSPLGVGQKKQNIRRCCSLPRAPFLPAPTSQRRHIKIKSRLVKVNPTSW